MKKIVNRLMYGKNNKQDLTPEQIQGESGTKLFFDILSAKYMELVKLNLILFVFSIPLLMWTYSSIILLTSDILIVDNGSYVVRYFMGLVPCLLILSPALGGAAYIIRNFTQDKHAWIWSDFWQRTKENFKQSFLFMLMFSLFLLLGQYVLYIYSIIDQGSMMTMIAKMLFVITYVFVIISTIYVYPMIVTYELKLKEIIKNSILLCIGRLGWTVLFVLLSIAPIILFILLSTVWGIFVIVLVLYLLLFGIAFAMYVQISYTTHTFDKYMNNSEDVDAENTQEDETQE